MIRSRNLFLVFLLTTLAACQTERGYVYVSQPELLTRERLIGQRWNETQFLQSKLDNMPDFSGFQGLEDRSIVNYFMDKLSLQYSPTGFGSPTGTTGSSTGGGGGTGAGGGSGSGATTGGNTAAANTPTTTTPPSGITITNTNTNTFPDSSSSGNTANANSAGSSAGGSSGTGGSGSGKSGGTNNAGMGTAANTGASSPDSTFPPPTTMPSGQVATTSTAKLSPIQQLQDQLAYRNAVNAALHQTILDDTHDLGGLTLYNLTFDLAVIPGKGADRPLIISLELDDRPWAERSEQELETSVSSPNKDKYISYQSAVDLVNALGGAQLTNHLVLAPYVAQIQKSVYGNWVKALNEELSQATRTTESRMLEDCLKESDLADIVNALDQIKDQTDLVQKLNLALPKEIGDFTSVGPTVSQFILKSHADRLKALNGGFSVAMRCRLTYAAALSIWYKYLTPVSSYVDLPVPQYTKTTDGMFVFTNTASISFNGLRNFYVEKSHLDQASLPRGFAIEPQEYAQNISDVSARQDILDLSLSLSAAFSQVNASNTTRYFNESQNLLQAIKRQPLAIGFGNGRRQFGWFLGPSFFVKDNLKPGFQQSPTRYTFSAEIGVPAWWSAAGLTGHCFWLNNDGTLTPATPGSPENFFTSQPFSIADSRLNPGEIWPPLNIDSAEQAPFPVLRKSDEILKTSFRSTTFVRFPTDPSAITTAIVYRNNRIQRLPSIEPVWHAAPLANGERPNYTLVAGATTDQTVLVRGRDLWRNPQVFIGSVPATKCDILPDMKGVVAHFINLAVPVDVGNGVPLQDLTVITTFGADTWPRAVQIVSPTAATQPAPTGIVLNSTYVVSVPEPPIQAHAIQPPIGAGAVAVTFVDAIRRLLNLPPPTPASTPKTDDNYLTFTAPASLVSGSSDDPGLTLWVRPLKPGEDANMAAVKRPYVAVPGKIQLAKNGTNVILSAEMPANLWLDPAWKKDFTENNTSFDAAHGVEMQAALSYANMPNTALVPVLKPMLFVFLPPNYKQPVALNDPKTITFVNGAFSSNITFNLGPASIAAVAYPALNDVLNTATNTGITLRLTELDDTDTVLSTSTMALMPGQYTTEPTHRANIPAIQAPSQDDGIKQLLTDQSLSIQGGLMNAPPAKPAAAGNAGNAAPDKTQDPFATFRNLLVPRTAPYRFKLELVLSPTVIIPVKDNLTINAPLAAIGAGGGAGAGGVPTRPAPVVPPDPAK